MRHSVAQIRRSIAAFPARSLADSAHLSHAAVAMILRENPSNKEVELLMIRRSEHPLDPWSGHMGFPGGRVDLRDESPLHAAKRETLEETGLNLERNGELLGRLSELRAKARQTIIPLSIFPFVFELTGSTHFTLNHEVAATFWIPLRFLLNAANRSSFILDPEGLSFPCYQYQQNRIWGLSLLMIDEFLFESLGSGTLQSEVSQSATRSSRPGDCTAND